MPNCVVKGCSNQSSIHKKEDGITFHTFPNRDEGVRDKWIAVVRASRNEETWQPTPRSVICSAHFLSDDLYYTIKGLRRVKKTAYPKILPGARQPLNVEDLSKSETIILTVKTEPLIIENEIKSQAAFLPVKAELLNEEDGSKSPAAILQVKAEPLHEVEISKSPTTILPDIPETLNKGDRGNFSTIHVTTVPDISYWNLNQSSASCAVQSVNIEQDPPIYVNTRKKNLQKRVSFLEAKQIVHKRKIKTLYQKVRRLHMRNKYLTQILRNLNVKINKKYIDSGDDEPLSP